MRHSVSISLPDAVFKQLKVYSKKENANWSEIIRRSLREHFFRSEFSRLHQEALLEASKGGLHLTEEEIFKQIS